MHKIISPLIFLIFSLLTLNVFAQKKFNYKNDFKRILTNTKNKNSLLFYDLLLKRFNKNDKSLSNFEVLALLIGFTSKPDYHPYQDLKTERNIYALNDSANYLVAIDSSNSFLKSHPLSVKALFEKSYAYHKLGQEDSAEIYAYRGRRIFQAMEFSGKGDSPENPIFALGPADGQDYIYKHIGGLIGGADIGMMGSSINRNHDFVDILEVVPRKGSKSYKLYFVIQHAIVKMDIEDKK